MNIVQWLYQWFFKRRILSTDSVVIGTQEITVKSTLQDWIALNQELHPLVRSLQLEIASIEVHRLTFDLLGISAYLLQIDICLSKNKVYYEILRKRIIELGDYQKQGPDLQSVFLKVISLCQKNYQIMQACKKALLETGLIKIKANDLFILSQIFEKQTTETAIALKNLSETTSKKSDLKNILLVEYGLNNLNPLYNPGNPGYHQGTLKSYYNYNTDNIEHLKTSILKIKQKDLKIISEALVNHYERLSKLFVFNASENLITAFKRLNQQIEEFIQASISLNIKTENIFNILNIFFREIETIRFMTHKKDVFTNNLQLALRTTKKQLRKMLEKTEIGREFIKLHWQMDIKEKLKMKSRFKSK